MTVILNEAPTLIEPFAFAVSKPLKAAEPWKVGGPVMATEAYCTHDAIGTCGYCDAYYAGSGMTCVQSGCSSLGGGLYRCDYY